MGTTVKVDPMRLGQAVRDGHRELLAGLVRIVQDAVLIDGPRHIVEAIETTAPFVPRDRGTYRREWRFERVQDGASVYNPLVYAPVLEEGRRPGGRPPPFAEILAWVLRKRLASTDRDARRIARAVQMKLAKRGMVGRHVLKRATPTISAAVDAAVVKYLSQTSPVST